ncbi:MAG: DUF1156 domain-containing protein [Chloroflexi bacterium]|nr:DUF1156 domain-containing protein [Chloroflexota bacterium]
MTKKLIEVALPLEAINKASAREKSIRHGHPSTLHLWWARRPLAACRAVLFASLIDDPDQPGVPQALLDRIDRLPLPGLIGDDWSRLSLGERRRQRLFAFIEKLVKWGNSNDERILTTARELINAATGGNPPPVLDPFCGGGSIPLEAQRLGLVAHASDLNPVAVLITKALIEIPPKFAGRPPVNPVDRRSGLNVAWKGAAGLAADVRYYGKWMRDEAEKRIGHLYPKVKLPKEQGGGEATVIAWLWARTVRCPNPACGAQMPLVRSFWLSTKPGKKAWIDPIVEKQSGKVRFEVRTGQGVPRDGTVNRRGAACITCGEAVEFNHIRSEGRAGGMNAQLMAIVAEGKGGRVYVPPTDLHESVADVPIPVDAPDTDLPQRALGFRVQLYGMRKHRDLFTPRQLVALTTLCDLVSEARERVRCDAVSAGLSGGDVPLEQDGEGVEAYSDALATYLAFGVDKNTVTNCTLATWQTAPDRLTQAFSRQAMPMTWDYAEANALSTAGGGFVLTLDSLAEVLLKLAANPQRCRVLQRDATSPCGGKDILVCTDPPYYDNIGYADLSDFFYVWLRRSIGKLYPDVLATLLTPKTEELVATPHRFDGDRERANSFFEDGLAKAFDRMHSVQHPDQPLTLFYAFKQAEASENGRADEEEGPSVVSTGWETMLAGLVAAGFGITGTWPMRTELITSLKKEVGALASSIVLVCRIRPENAPLASRREFLGALKRELPEALRKLQLGNIAPVDLAQAAIGPGMAVFSRYRKVLEAGGAPMSVRTALALINQALDEVLSEQEAEYDADTRWAVAWFQQFGTGEGPYGAAETLSKAKDSSVDGLVEAGIATARAGKVRLLRRDELPDDWDPLADRRLTVWEVTHHLTRALEQHGEDGAAGILAKVGALADVARDLAYRLYTTCERKGWAQDGFAYNSLVVAWPEIERVAAQQQGRLV